MAAAMRIACVQLRARGVDEAERALEEALEAADRAAGDADLVTLPEATYPGYILHEGWSFEGDGYERARAGFADVARRQGAWIAVGLVRPVGDGLVNSAVLMNPDGDVAAIADKRFLWHFDSRWFREGAPGDVVLLPWGAIGMFVCADARMPEIPRRLALGGARLLLDPTALVLSPLGTNAQLEYMLAARAWENGAFLAVANKCGTEAGIARYGGRSAISIPRGCGSRRRVPGTPRSSSRTSGWMTRRARPGDRRGVRLPSCRLRPDRCRSRACWPSRPPGPRSAWRWSEEGSTPRSWRESWASIW